MYHPQRDRRFVLARRGRGEVDFPIAQDHVGRALHALRASLLFAFLRAGVLPRDLEAQLALHGTLSDEVEETPILARAAVTFSAH